MVVGCCGFPVRRALYAKHLAGVEIQQTFYQPPAPTTAARWREEVPAGFVFCLKAWQLITHPPTSPTYRRLRMRLPPEEAAECGYLRPTEAVRRAWEATVAVVRAVGADCILLQTPASFGPEAEHLASLRATVPELRRAGIPLAWEPRGAWTPDQVAALCAELSLIPAGDPFGPMARALRGPVRYRRLHGRTGFGYRYTDADFEELRALLAEGGGADHRLLLFQKPLDVGGRFAFRRPARVRPPATGPRWGRGARPGPSHRTASQGKTRPFRATVTRRFA